MVYVIFNINAVRNIIVYFKIQISDVEGYLLLFV